MSDTEYEDMYEIYNIFCLTNKLKLLCAGVDSHINKIYCAFHTLKDFNMTRQQSGETVTIYFERLKSAQVNAELSKGNLTKHKQLGEIRKG